jgi:putative toxin-antitoxin system antitoxin component (TIGR02293 family)
LILAPPFFLRFQLGALPSTPIRIAAHSGDTLMNETIAKLCINISMFDNWYAFTRQFSVIYSLPPLVRIALIENGIPASHLNSLAVLMEMNKEDLLTCLRLSRTAVQRKIKEEQTLTTDESERVLGLESLIGQVSTMMAESGTKHDNFDAAKWVATWLQAPIPALGNKRPADYMKTIEGQKYISSLLMTVRGEAYV